MIRQSLVTIAAVAATLASVHGTTQLVAAPIPRDQLQVTSVINTADALFGANSNSNPRHFNGNNFAVQINNTSGVVRQPAGGEESDATLWLTGEPEARMVSPFDGGKSTDWLLLGGGANEPQFSRVPLNAEDAADREYAGPINHEPKLTGVSSVVTTIDDASGDGSWGLWTVKESDGHLYVHTSHDGVYVYEMENAMTTGSLAIHYTKGYLVWPLLENSSNRCNGHT